MTAEADIVAKLVLMVVNSRCIKLLRIIIIIITYIYKAPFRIGAHSTLH